MLPPKVLVIGCGIAGPVIALLLKKKGYNPIVLEKVKELSDAGASLMLFPNGLKVLALLDIFDTDSTTNVEEFCDQKYSGENLGVSELPLKFKEKYGQPAFGVKRTTLNLILKNALKLANIEIHEGWKLKDIVEEDDSVIAVSQSNEKIQGSFLIGCDGIKAVSRSLILKQNGSNEEEVSYTGLTQTAGMSPTPSILLPRRTILSIYGPGAHLICYPVSSNTTSWAITQRNLNPAQETWKICSSSELNVVRSQLEEQFKDWCSPVPELIRGAERIIKYGLFDRPHLEPEQWYSKGGRCVLVGDAAHPTSPHLGQGANQALEDCYHLSQLLPDVFVNNELRISTEYLQNIFDKFAKMRQPRTAELVKGARRQGELRVCDGGAEACAKRDNIIRKYWENTVEEYYDGLLKEPF